MKATYLFIQPKEGDYYFGKVIKTDIISKNQMFEGMLLIYVYKLLSHDKEIPSNLEESELLFPPAVVNFQGWLKGYFETLGNRPVTEKEASLDFGFYKVLDRDGKCYSLEGEELAHTPKYKKINGLASCGYVGYEAHRCKICS